MAQTHETPKGAPAWYYQEYASADTNVRSYFDVALKSSQHETRDVLQNKGPITCIALGSATERSIDELRNFVRKQRPTLNTQDHYLFLDISPISVSRHMDHKIAKDYQDVEVIQGDMNSAPLRDESADFIIMDYTINFNQTLDEYQQTLENIHRLLKPNGVCILTLSTNSEENRELALPDPSLTQSRTNTTTIRREELKALLKATYLSYKIIRNGKAAQYRDPEISLVLRKASETRANVPPLIQHILNIFQAQKVS